MEAKRPLPTIRRATAADYDQIIAVWATGGGHFSAQGRESLEAFRRQVELMGHLYFVAVDGDRVIGVVLGSHDHRKGWVNRLAVLPEYRRRGVAAALVSTCDAAIRACGIEIVAALVETHNAASIALFERLGYHADVPVLYFRKLSQPGA